jgi:hypothetical protein
MVKLVAWIKGALARLRRGGPPPEPPPEPPAADDGKPDA